MPKPAKGKGGGGIIGGSAKKRVGAKAKGAGKGKGARKSMAKGRTRKER